MDYVFYYQKTKELFENGHYLAKNGLTKGVIKALDHWLGLKSEGALNQLNPFDFANDCEMPIEEVMALFGELRTTGFFTWYIVNTDENRMISVEELQGGYKSTPFDVMFFSLNAVRRASNEQGGYQVQ